MTHVKICGITRLPDALAALEAGAHMLGFNFYPPSPRSITPAECARLTSSLLPHFPHAILVGVFVNMPVDQILAIMTDCSLHLAQLHGDENAHTISALSGRAFKAFRGVPTADEISDYTNFNPGLAPAFLQDASVQGLYGGSGLQANWSAATPLARQHPILLAGGLKPENVAAAINQVHPWGVDTASGVETRPGQKDPIKIKDFINAALAVSK